MAFNEQQLDEIARTQEQRGLTRKMAVQFCTRKWKREQAAPAAAGTPAAQGIAAARQENAQAAPAAPAAKQPKSAAKPKREKVAARRQGGKGSVSTGLIAAELRADVVKRMTKHGDSNRAIAVALGWAEGNGYGMVKRIQKELGIYKG